MVTKTTHANILVVDDDPEIVSLLRRGLVFEGFNVDTAADGAEALAKIREKPPDLVVLDIMMPEIDGIEVTKRLRQVSDLPVLMLSAKGTIADKLAGFNIGADDYLVKPFAFDELLARVRALLKRREAQAAEILTFGDITLDPSAREVARGSRQIKLTAQEFALLEYLMRHPRQVLTRDQIYEKVWGYDFGGESNVIEVYIRYLRSKLEPEGTPKLIHTVRGVGYVLRE
jgi:two-component system response regulator MprA